ncbi:CH, partial [Musa troglodytarum]
MSKPLFADLAARADANRVQPLPDSPTLRSRLKKPTVRVFKCVSPAHNTRTLLSSFLFSLLSTPFFSAFALQTASVRSPSPPRSRWRRRRTAMALLGKILGLRGGLGLKELRADQSITDELAIRKAEEAASRRYQAAKWLRQVDQGASETLPEEPTEEEFFLALRNGLILCNVLNRVNPGAVPKVVENPVITIQSTDAAAQSAIQYFENMRNFLVAVGDMKLLTFEASDLEKGGSSNKVVDCILCLKGYHEWKLAGGVGVWRYGGIVKITTLRQRLQSSFLGGGSSDEPADDYSMQNNQQFCEFLHLVAEATLEESKTSNALNILFDQFGIQLLKAFLAECGDAEDFPMVEMFIDLVLDQAVKEFHMSLASQKDQLSLLLKKAMKGQNKTVTKAHLMEAVSKFLKRSTCDSSFSSMENREVKLDNQQKQLETLKMSFHEIKNEVECSQKKWKEDFENFECQVQGLKLNSSAYLKLVEENRLLYNQVQDLKGNIRVYCRVRPFLPKQSDRRSTVEHIGENGNIVIVDHNKQGKDARKIFAFNKVFGENTTQSEIFSDTQPLIRSVLDGYNVCIFAYGQTGSGKTYTMSGPDITAEETWGVNYRALHDLFEISQSRQGIISYEVSVQMIEIYNEQVRDLLVADGSNRR